MAQEKTYNLNEAHKYFAQLTNGRVWGLLQKSGRSQVENDEMLVFMGDFDGRESYGLR